MKKQLLVLLLSLFALPAIARPQPAALGTDYVYIYGGEKNTTYQCNNYLTYFDTEGHSVLYSEGCVQTGVDFGTWPVFPPQPIHLVMHMQNVKLPDIDSNCQFVGYANTNGGDTSTVVDCR